MAIPTAIVAITSATQSSNTQTMAITSANNEYGNNICQKKLKWQQHLPQKEWQQPFATYKNKLAKHQPIKQAQHMPGGYNICH